jgi:hypothetical protein
LDLDRLVRAAPVFILQKNARNQSLVCTSVPPLRSLPPSQFLPGRNVPFRHPTPQSIPRWRRHTDGVRWWYNSSRRREAAYSPAAVKRVQARHSDSLRSRSNPRSLAMVVKQPSRPGGCAALPSRPDGCVHPGGQQSAPPYVALKCM